MRIPIAIGLLVVAFAAGCGSDDDDGGGGGGKSVSEAKADLVESCHRGHEGDEADLKLCRCVGDRLEQQHGYDSAEKFDAGREKVEDNEVPSEVQAAVNSCQAEQK